MALAYARLANAEGGTRNAEQQRGLRGANDLAGQFRVPTSAFRVVESILRHPDLIAGEGRPCTEIMRAHPGRVIAKVGAEGVYCALLTQQRLGVALKVADGHAVASALAMAAVLEELGLRPRPAGLTARPNVNTRRSEEHTSELQSRLHLVCRLLLEKKKQNDRTRLVPQPLLLLLHAPGHWRQARHRLAHCSPIRSTLSLVFDYIGRRSLAAAATAAV